MAADRRSMVEVVLGIGAIAGALYAIGRIVGWLWQKIRSLISLYTTYENNTALLQQMANDFAVHRKDLTTRLEELRLQTLLTAGLVQATAHRDPDGLWLSDAGGRALWLNPSLLLMMGMTSDQATGEGWRAAIHQDDRERVYEEWDAAVAQHRIFTLTYRYATGVRIQATTYVIRDPLYAGQVVGYVGLVTRLAAGGAV